jgi:hypothetical protein
MQVKHSANACIVEAYDRVPGASQNLSENNNHNFCFETPARRDEAKGPSSFSILGQRKLNISVCVSDESSIIFNEQLNRPRKAEYFSNDSLAYVMRVQLSSTNSCQYQGYCSPHAIGRTSIIGAF